MIFPQFAHLHPENIDEQDPHARLVAVAVATDAYGCSKEEPKAAEAPKTTAPPPPPAEEVVTVKIGHAGPLTGGIAHPGKDDENGVHLAVDEATERKVKIGGKVIRFEMMSEDDQADANSARDRSKFVDAKVAGVVGHLNWCDHSRFRCL